MSFKHEKPAIAAKALNTLVEQFKDKHIDVYSDPKSSFLEEQTGTFSEKLKQVEDKLQSLSRDTRSTLSMNKGQRFCSSELPWIPLSGQPRRRCERLNRRLPLSKAQDGVLKRSWNLRHRLRALQQKERELLERYTENSRMVQNIRKEIQAVEESVAGPLEDARRIELSKLEGELGALKAKADGLHRQVGQISGEVRALDAREKEYLNLKRDLGTQEGNYKTYLGKFEESRIVDDMNKRKLSNVSVIQNATVPIRPAREQKETICHAFCDSWSWCSLWSGISP